MSKLQGTASRTTISPTPQTSIWDEMRRAGEEPPLSNPFALSPEEEKRRRKIAEHKNWLASFAHECPSPYKSYRIGVYIRY